VVTAPAPGTPVEVTSDHPTRAPRFRLVLLSALVVALVVAGGFAWKLSVDRHLWGSSSQAEVSQSQRDAVMTQTQQFVLRVNTYGPKLLAANGQMPTYRTRVTDVITPKFAVSFDQSVSAAEQSVKQYGLNRTCAVFSTGVELMDSDSAQVLVAGSISQTVRNKKGKDVSTGEPSPFRLRVSLVRMDGKWLVDNYAPVTTS
jgi:Mce-associated membrane protein